MTGKQLRQMHRKTMWRIGGLAMVEDEDCKLKTGQTEKYKPLKPWLELVEQPQDIRAAAREWRKRKRAA